MKSPPRPPVVVLGAHRSGTTLVMRLLEAAGVFAGKRQDRNSEAWFFLRHDEWLLRRAGGAWDRPAPVTELLAAPGLRREAAAAFAAAARSAAFAREYLGTRFGAASAPWHRPWGFKDPRLAFTWPAWSAVFPGARLVVVHRDGVDVAASLRRRTEERQARGDSVLRRWSLASRLKAAWPPVEFLNHFSLGARCQTLAAAFALWEEYAVAAEERREAHDGPTLALRYEDLLADPARHVASLLRFAEAPRDDVPALVSTIRRERARAWRDDGPLRELHATVRDRPIMRRLGYDDGD